MHVTLTEFLLISCFLFCTKLFSFIKIESLNELSELLESGDAESHTKKKTKRMRTTFTEEQVQILQANFQIDSNPDGQDLERIAQITGLSKRVTQVRMTTKFRLIDKTSIVVKCE